MKTARYLILIMAMLLGAFAPARAFVSGNAGVNPGGSVVPGTNEFFANPTNIYPAGTGNIWFVDGNTGSDSNNCKGPAAACATINHALALAGDGTNDVVIVEPKVLAGVNGPVGFYNENVVISKSWITLMSANYTPAPTFQSVVIQPTAGVGIAITGAYVKVIGVFVFAEDSAVTMSGPAQNSNVGFTLLYNALISDGVAGATVLVDGPTAGVYADIEHNLIVGEGGPGSGLELKNDTEGTTIIGNDFFSYGAAAVIKTDNLLSAWHGIIQGNHFNDFNGAVYIDTSATNATAPPVIVGNTFNTTTLTLAQVKTPTGTYPGTNSPPGEMGSTATVNKTITSSAVLSGSTTNILTASGDVFVTKVVGMTDSTGLAGCTNYVIKQDRAIGATTVASETIVALGASATFDFANGATTALLPFSLASGGHIQDQATTTNCTGAGTMQLSVTYIRETPYASLQ